MFGLSRLFNRSSPQDRFAREVMDLLAKMTQGTTYEYEPALFRLQASDGQIIFLDNAYNECRRTSGLQRKKVLASFLAGMAPSEIPADFDDARAHILPVLRHVAGLESVQLECKPEQAASIWTEFPMQPFSGDLAIAMAFDSENAVLQVGKSVLDKWQRPLDEVLAIALDNLRAKAPAQFELHAPGLYVSRYGDYYDASRLLLPELAWQLPVRGTPVAMVPNRMCLLVTGENDIEGIAAMIATAEKILIDDSRPLGSEMFRAVDQGWKTWQPDGANGVHLQNLQLRMRASDYAQQKRAFEHRMSLTGEDVFVATFTVTQRQDIERFHSLSVLTKGADTLLPKTDLIYLTVVETKETISVPWSAFEHIAGYLLEPLPFVLPRYRVRHFPTDDEMERLREAQDAEVKVAERVGAFQLSSAVANQARPVIQASEQAGNASYMIFSSP